jgi:DNA-binding protein H-NS
MRSSLGVVPVLEKLENLNLHSPSIVGETADGKSLIAAPDLASMSVDELWSLRENIDTILAGKINAELNELRKRLDRLSPRDKAARHAIRKRLKAPAQKQQSSRSVLPKYRNPIRPVETWSGRGRRPLWLKEQLVAGRLLEDFRLPEHKSPASSV